MSVEGTPRPWGALVLPTAEELAAWLVVCTDAERLVMAGRYLQASDVAVRCFQGDHDNLLAEVRALGALWAREAQARRERRPLWWTPDGGVVATIPADAT